MATLPEQLRAAAAGLDITARLDAHKLSKSTYYRVLRGKFEPRFAFLLALACALDLDIRITPQGVTVEPWLRAKVDQDKPTSSQ